MNDPLQAFMEEFEGACVFGDPTTMIEGHTSKNFDNSLTGIAGGFTLGTDLRLSLAHIDIDYRLGDVVYHAASEDGVKGIVTGYTIRPGSVGYLVSWGNTRGEAMYFACELTTEKPL